MATPEEEIKDLRAKNNELVQKVQYWKMTAGQREDEKVALMKEINELRLKLSRVRSNGNVQASKLDAELQSASEKALAHLVRASGEIARTMDLAKAYMRDRQELETISPRWSSMGSTPNSDKVHRVLPTMMGGQSIQPVVALSRTTLNTSNNRFVSRSPAQNRNVTERAVPIPMHMLQDVYIPLTRIDIADVHTSNIDTDADTTPADNSADDLGLDDSDERPQEDTPMSDEENFENSRRLEAVTEDVEPEEDMDTPQRTRMENPLEGPSWLLDSPKDAKGGTKFRRNLEPDSTTELEEARARSSIPKGHSQSSAVAEVACQFSPTVRRRRRPSSPEPPRYSPRASRNSTNGRVLKVMVAKMRLEGGEGEEGEEGEKAGEAVEAGAEGEAGGAGDTGASPPKRPMRLDAPSPNGATDAGVIVSVATLHDGDCISDDSPIANVTARNTTRKDRRESRESRYESHVRAAEGQMARAIADGAAGHSRAGLQGLEARARDASRDSRATSRGSLDSRDSDSGSGGGGGHVSEGRTRRPRKAVTYKEKPLNRKMRR